MITCSARRLCHIILATLFLSSAGSLHAHPGADATLDHYSRRLAADPGDTEARLARVLVHIDAGHLEAAAKDLRQLENNGGKSYHYLWGLVEFRRDNPTGALAHLDAALAMQPTDWRAALLRGKIHQALGHEHRALADYKIAIDGQSYSDPGVIMASARLAQQLGNSEEALALLDLGMGNANPPPPLQLAAVDILVSQQRYNEAIKRLQTLVNHSPDNPQWHLRLARLQAANGRERSARQSLEHARRLAISRKPTPWRTRLMSEIARLERDIEPVPASAGADS